MITVTLILVLRDQSLSWAGTELSLINATYLVRPCPLRHWVGGLKGSVTSGSGDLVDSGSVALLGVTRLQVSLVQAGL